MRVILSCAVLLVAACSSEKNDQLPSPFDPHHQDPRCAQAIDVLVSKGGVISSERIAKKVAAQYLAAILVNDDLLLDANLKNGIWTVSRSADASRVGGSAAIQMCQSNGRVLAIHLGK
jgi:hypothetical protein